MVIKERVRLSKAEINALKNATLKRDKDAKIYLFGSRTDSTKKGGDIDILILSQALTNRDIRHIRLDFFRDFGEQKLDILLDTPKMEKPFTSVIFKESIPL